MNTLRQLRALPRSLRVLFVATLINRSGTMVLPYLALYLTEGLHAGASAAGTVLAVYGAGAVVTPSIAGRLVDRLGALRVMRGSLIGSGLLLLVYPFAKSVSQIVPLTLALSLVAEAFRPASLAVVADAVPAAQRKTAFVIIRFAINLGMSIGPAIGGLLAAVSFQALFYIDGATSIAAGVLLAVVRWSDVPREADAVDATDSVDARATNGASPVHVAGGSSLTTAELAKSASAVAPTAPAVASTASAVTPTASAVASTASAVAPSPVVQRWTFVRLLLASFLLALVFFQFESSLPLFVVRDAHASEAFFGALITFNTVIIIFAEIPLNLRMDAWPHPRSMGLGAFFTAIGFGVLVFGAHLPLIVASVPLWTFGEMILFPATSAYVSELAPPGRTGSYMGMHTTAFGLAFALGPFAGIYLLDHFGSTVLWSTALFVGLVASAMFATLPSARPPASASTGSPH